MSGPLRILMVLDSYPPDTVGGAERVAHGWSRELAARGHEVRLLAGRIGRPAGEEEAVAGYRVRRWSSRRRTFWDGYASALRACGRAAGRLIGELRPDIVHCHQGLSAYALSRLEADLPTVCTFHAPWHEEFLEDARARRASLPPLVRTAYGGAARLKSAVVRRMESRALAQCKGVAVLSAFSRERLAAAHAAARGKIEILPAGVDLERFAPISGAEREALRRRLGFAGPTLLSVRRLVRRMGLDHLIGALPAVRRRVPEARLVLVGRGPERGPLERLAGRLGLGGAVHFAGFVPDEELPDYYRAADLFVLPTRSLEGYGVATLEALASGTPVVGTPAGATPEILRPIEEGLLARAAAPEDLAEAILRWFTRMESLPALRERCRKWIEEHYRWSDAGRAMEAYYRRLLAA